MLFFTKGKPTEKIWFYQLDPGRSLGKTNPLNDDDLKEFVQFQAGFKKSERSWFLDLEKVYSETAELRTIWSRSDTRKSLLTGLAELGYGDEQLKEIAKITNTEQSDLFDVLIYIAYGTKPPTRQERVIKYKDLIFSKYTGKQQEFLDFVLNQYIQEGVGELDRQKLPRLLSLKYHTTNDAIAILGNIQTIGEIFISFQPYLYADRVVN